MGKLKSAVEYLLLGKDIIENRRKSNSLNTDRGLGTKVIDAVRDVTSFTLRYAPFVLEFNGVSDLIEGKYQSGTLKLIIAEWIRISEYMDSKSRKEIFDTLITYRDYCKEREALIV